MEYLKPIESLEKNLRFYQQMTAALIGVITLIVIILPNAAKHSNPLLIKTDQSVSLAEVSSWNLSVDRLERFAKAYLSARFEWTADNFGKKKDSLKELTSESVFSSLKTPLTSFESLAQTQGAKSYYVLEDFGFSNAKKLIEAKITRVIRIKNAALATPLQITLTFDEASLSESNPFGLTVVGLDESEISSDGK